MLTLKLAGRLLMRRWGASAALGAVCALLMAAHVLNAGLMSSDEQTRDAGRAAQGGGASHALDPRTPSGRAVLQRLVTASPLSQPTGVAAVSRASVVVRASGSATSADLVTWSAPRPAAVVLSGTSAAEAGQVCLSPSVADKLGVSRGDRVRIENTELTVVGLCVDPMWTAHPLALTIGPVDPSQAAYVAVEESAVNRAPLAAAIESGAIQAERIRSLPDPVPESRWVMQLLWIIGPGLMVSAVLAWRSARRDDIAGLVAAGIRVKAARRVCAIVVLVAALLGGLVGAVTGQAVLPVIARSQARTRGQWPVVGSVPALPAVVFGGLLVIVGLLAAVLSARRRTAVSRPSWWIVGPAGVVVLVAMADVLSRPSDAGPGAFLRDIIALACALPWLFAGMLRAVSWLPRSRGSLWIVRSAVASGVAVSATCVALVVGPATWLSGAEAIAQDFNVTSNGATGDARSLWIRTRDPGAVERVRQVLASEKFDRVLVLEMRGGENQRRWQALSSDRWRCEQTHHSDGSACAFTGKAVEVMVTDGNEARGPVSTVGESVVVSDGVTSAELRLTADETLGLVALGRDHPLRKQVLHGSVHEYAVVALGFGDRAEIDQGRIWSRVLGADPVAFVTTGRAQQANLSTSAWPVALAGGVLALIIAAAAIPGALMRLSLARGAVRAAGGPRRSAIWNVVVAWSTLALSVGLVLWAALPSRDPLPPGLVWLAPASAACVMWALAMLVGLGTARGGHAAGKRRVDNG